MFSNEDLLFKLRLCQQSMNIESFFTRQYSLLTFTFVGIVLMLFSIFTHPIVSDLFESEVWRGIDFNHYYATSVLVLDGKIPYGIPFSSLGLEEHFSFSEAASIPKATNPPALAVFLAPLALLKPLPAWITWQLSLLLYAILTVYLSLKFFKLNLSKHALVLFIIGTIFSPPFVQCFKFSQIGLFLTLLTIAGAHFTKTGKLGLSGAMWGLAIALKYYFWPLGLYAFLFGDARQRTWLIVSFLGFSILPVIIFGPEIYYAFYQEGLPIVKEWQLTNQNFNFFIATERITKYFFDFDLFYEKSRSFFVILVSSIVSLLIAINLGFRNKAIEHNFTVLCTVSTLLAPVAWDHYHTILIFPACYILSYFGENKFKFFLSGLLLYALWIILPYHPFFRGQLTGLRWFWFFGQYTILSCLSLITLSTLSRKLVWNRDSLPKQHQSV